MYVHAVEKLLSRIDPSSLPKNKTDLHVRKRRSRRESESEKKGLRLRQRFYGIVNKVINFIFISNVYKLQV